MCNPEWSNVIILTQPCCSTSGEKKNPTEKHILADLLLPKQPSTDINSLYECFCKCLQLPDKNLWKYQAYLDKQILISPGWEEKRQKAPDLTHASVPKTTTICKACFQSKKERKKKNRTKKTPNPQQLVLSFPQQQSHTLCHEVSYNLAFSQLAVQYYSLYTQVSLAQKAIWAMISKQVTCVFA